MSPRALVAALLTVVLFSALVIGLLPEVYADTFGYTTVPSANETPGYLMCTRATLSATGSVTSMSFYSGVSGNVKVGIYDNSGSAPGTLVIGPVEKTGSTAGAWNSVSVSPSVALSAGTYWICDQISILGATKVDRTGTMTYRSLSYGTAWPSAFGSGGSTGTYSDGVYATYTPTPPGPDFTIAASPTSQSIGAGNTASFALNLAAVNDFTETVSLGVTSGCPSGVTCTVSPDSITSYPGSATLSVPTLITTSGSYSVVVHAQSTSKSHDVTVTLSVTAPASYSFNVKSGATQIVVTLTYTWTGSGTPPAGNVTIVGPGGTPQYPESSGAVYDRTSIAVTGSSNTYALLHRVTFTVSDISSPQIWIALVSLASVSTYNITIEVS